MVCVVRLELTISWLKVKCITNFAIRAYWWRVRDLNSWLPPWKGGGFTARLTRRIYASSFRGVQHFLALNQVVLHLFHNHNVANHCGRSCELGVWPSKTQPMDGIEPPTPRIIRPLLYQLSYIGARLCLSKVSTRLSARSSCFPPIFRQRTTRILFWWGKCRTCVSTLSGGVLYPLNYLTIYSNIQSFRYLVTLYFGNKNPSYQCRH